MTTSVPKIIEDFYDAAWDLAGDLIYLRDKAVQAGTEQTSNPQTITSRFREKAAPFLNLTGKDLAQELHLPFMEIEEVLNETVFPGLMVLDEEWKNLYPAPGNNAEPKHPNEPRALDIINHGCAALCNAIEMEIIAPASTMRL